MESTQLPLPGPWNQLEVEFRTKVPHDIFSSRMKFLDSYDGWVEKTPWQERRDWYQQDGVRFSVHAPENGPVTCEGVQKRVLKKLQVTILRSGTGEVVGAGKVVVCQEVPLEFGIRCIHQIKFWRHKQSRTYRTKRWSFVFSRVWESRRSHADLLQRRRSGEAAEFEIEIEAINTTNIFMQGGEYVLRSLILKIEDMYRDSGDVIVRQEKNSVKKHHGAP